MSNRYDVRGESKEGHQRKVRALFNSVAGRYDLLNHTLSLGIDHLWRRDAIRALSLDHNSVVLDLATGTGDLSASAAHRRNPARIVGVDPARAMLIQSAAKSMGAQTRYSPVESFGEDLPFRENSFTHAMIAYGIRNVSDRPAVFAELARVTCPGGLLAVLEFARPRNVIVRRLFDLYFFSILPWIGGLVSRDREAYEYLPNSVARFVTPDELAEEAGRAGWQRELVKDQFFGVSVLSVFCNSKGS